MFLFFYSNSLYAKEINAIEMLKKQPQRPIVKGSRVKYQNKLNNSKAGNDAEEEKKDEDKAEESAQSESEEEASPSPPPPAPATTTKTSTASISSLRSTSTSNDVDTSTNKTSIKSRFGDRDREEKKDTSTPIVIKTTVGVGISSRFPKRDPEPEPAATKPIGIGSSRYGTTTRNDRITSAFDKRSTSNTSSAEENNTSTTRVPYRPNPRLGDEKNDSDTNSSSAANRYRPKKTTDDNNTWRTPRKKEVWVYAVSSFLLLISFYCLFALIYFNMSFPNSAKCVFVLFFLCFCQKIYGCE